MDTRDRVGCGDLHHHPLCSGAPGVVCRTLGPGVDRRIGRDNPHRRGRDHHVVPLTQATGADAESSAVDPRHHRDLRAVDPESATKPRRIDPFPRVRGAGDPPPPSPSTRHGQRSRLCRSDPDRVSHRDGGRDHPMDLTDPILGLARSAPQRRRRRPRTGHPVAGGSALRTSMGPTITPDRSSPHRGATHRPRCVPGEHPSTSRALRTVPSGLRSPHEFAQPHGRVRPPALGARYRRLHLTPHSGENPRGGPRPRHRSGPDPRRHSSLLWPVSRHLAGRRRPLHLRGQSASLRQGPQSGQSPGSMVSRGTWPRSNSPSRGTRTDSWRPFSAPPSRRVPTRGDPSFGNNSKDPPYRTPGFEAPPDPTSSPSHPRGPSSPSFCC